MLDVREYLDIQGQSPFGAWFSDLDAVAASKVTIAVARIEQGNLSNVKPVGEGVLEYRINSEQVTAFILGGTATYW